MSEAIAQLLGVNNSTLSALRAGKMPDMLGAKGVVGKKSAFGATLLEMLSAADDTDPTQAVPYQENAITRLFKDSVLSTLQSSNEDSAGETAEGEEDLFASSPLNNTADAMAAGDSSSLISASDVVFLTGNSNGELIQQINSADTIEKRLEFSVQLRDKIINALKDAGHTAYDIGKPDKISIDGNLVDVIKSSRTLGKEAKVQFMEVKAATAADSVSSAIFSAGEKEQDLIPQISAETNPAQRRLLATQFRDQIVANLKTEGYDASAGSSPDKIEVNGTTYDIIRSLNSIGSKAFFQVAKA